MNKYQELEVLYREWIRKLKDCEDFFSEESAYRFDAMMELFNQRYDKLDEIQKKAWNNYQEFRDKNFDSAEKTKWENYRILIDKEN